MEFLTYKITGTNWLYTSLVFYCDEYTIPLSSSGNESYRILWNLDIVEI